MKKLVFATNNPHKLEEIRAILGSIFPRLRKLLKVTH